MAHIQNCELHNDSPQHIYNMHMTTTSSIKERGPSTFSCLIRVCPSVKEKLDHIFVTLGGDSIAIKNCLSFKKKLKRIIITAFLQIIHMSLENGTLMRFIKREFMQLNCHPALQPYVVES